MKVEFAAIFEKDLRNIRDVKILKYFKALLADAEIAETPYQITGVKKLKGSRNAYRIRIADYRIGFYVVSRNTLLFKRILHRKDIYKYFP